MLAQWTFPAPVAEKVPKGGSGREGSPRREEGITPPTFLRSPRFRIVTLPAPYSRRRGEQVEDDTETPVSAMVSYLFQGFGPSGLGPRSSRAGRGGTEPLSLWSF